MAKKLKPVHPGEHLREDFLKPYRLSMNKLAMDLRVPVTRIADIVGERRGITRRRILRGQNRIWVQGSSLTDFQRRDSKRRTNGIRTQIATSVP